jgi:hypothetical protein
MMAGTPGFCVAVNSLLLLKRSLFGLQVMKGMDCGAAKKTHGGLVLMTRRGREENE